MPQVYIVLGSNCPSLLRRKKDKMDELADRFVATVEKSFCITGLNDVVYTVVEAHSTCGEADIQVEVRYTAGTDEYGKGFPFDPDEKTREALTEILYKEFSSFLEENHAQTSDYSISVWVIPLRGTSFKAFNMPIP